MEEASKAGRFLDLYRQIEELLERRYAKENRLTSNVFIRFTSEKQGARYREELNLCREIRNVLSHHAAIQGQPVVEPAEGLIRVMERLSEELQKPPLAMDYATPAEQIIQASPRHRVRKLMTTMSEKGFSHIPVREEGAIRGVFSVSSVFDYVRRYPDRGLTEDTRVADFAEFLPVENHGERFLFAGPELTYWEAREVFGQVYKHRRLAVIFLTEDGSKTGRLLGMLTPWDVLGLDEEITAEEMVQPAQ